MNIFLAISAGLFVYSWLLFLGNGVVKRGWTVYKRLRMTGKLYRSQDQDQVRESFQDRVVEPLFEQMARGLSVLFPLSQDSEEKLQLMLMRAGIKKEAKDYIAMTMIYASAFAVAGGAMGAVVWNQMLPGALLCGVLGYYLRKYSLASAITRRRKSILNQTPQVLDLLSVCVEAGLSFDQGLKYVTEKTEGELTDELVITQRQMVLGRSKKEALTELAERNSVEELTLFVGSILQAEELGISVKNVLESQSEAIQENFKQRVEEDATKLPIKILFPIMFFIFPVLFIILITPTAINVLIQFGII